LDNAHSDVAKKILNNHSGLLVWRMSAIGP
jgi:hypothetical protein